MSGPSVAIFGLGRIGSTYDAGQSSPTPRSHVGAALKTGWQIAALADSSAEAREAAKRQWPALAHFVVGPDECEGITADAVAVCTPPANRLDDIERALQLRPRLLLLEKPLALDLQTAVDIVTRCNAAGVALRVNFHRRFDAGHQRFRALSGGEPRMAILKYGKGLFNYGSHMVDLLTDWFGPIDAVQALMPMARPAATAEAADPMVSFRCAMRRGFEAVVLAVEGIEFDQFDAEFLFRDKVIELRNGGVERRSLLPIADLYYQGYTHLREATDLTEVAEVSGLAGLYEAAYAHLRDGAGMPGCTGEAAAAGIAVLQAVLRSRDAGGAIEPVRIAFG
jgi:predicted dehydrogenase